jgi:predicted  nucleic acid-binding Zn-ribbon protein
MKMEVRCTRCGHRWNYRGASRYYATCPRCLRKVKLEDPPPKG